MVDVAMDRWAGFREWRAIWSALDHAVLEMREPLRPPLRRRVPVVPDRCPRVRRRLREQPSGHDCPMRPERGAPCRGRRSTRGGGAGHASPHNTHFSRATWLLRFDPGNEPPTASAIACGGASAPPSPPRRRGQRWATRSAPSLRRPRPERRLSATAQDPAGRALRAWVASRAAGLLRPVGRDPVHAFGDAYYAERKCCGRFIADIAGPKLHRWGRPVPRSGPGPTSTRSSGGSWDGPPPRARRAGREGEASRTYSIKVDGYGAPLLRANGTGKSTGHYRDLSHMSLHFVQGLPANVLTIYRVPNPEALGPHSGRQGLAA